MSKKRERFKLSLSVFMILIREDGKILMLKRSNTGWMDGYYSLPAGAVDGKERLRAAIIRETKEEVDISINENDLELIHAMHTQTNDEEWMGIYFAAHKWEGQEKVNEPHKHSEVVWHAPQNLPEMTIPYVRQAIEHFLQNRNYSEFGW